MADQQITIPDLGSLTAGQASDLLLATRGTTGYKMLLSDLAKYMVETYNSSSLAGSAQSVKNALDSLNSSMEPSFITSPDIVLAENESGATVFVRKVGRIATMRFMGASTTHTNDQVLFTIPSGYRPINTHDFLCQKGGSIGVVRVASNGSTALWINPSTTAAAGRIYFSGTYVTET